ncbi:MULTISPECIES: TetR/AcrR family transcriptional regulator [unclassified Mesorhizobium]|uniref:TetR/AcrR family transcriptional regulator n=1 Tax=unclassified Mesorhizobium TaxID=325217 RepID=UPI000FE72EFC|nr:MULTISPECIES: TetR/AcrR family transcriptional regulator [unclassified Mesorhizobium]RWI28371.1 MAG: TetR/AcrR family transcriptional regulator [Mesorhizobium sp.]RWK47184.1 MAG: TetR/AcrR family transcriptional regulator [Mesorhizobium sp.]RWK96573.1 MAG: TetR/AcrR family transcriptional regulator [Mesorhizobium sp.]RWL10258.1 MAG: TetR/AcrR family transcriptional regulator [Mesorhizobium sp.]TIP58963.1 MAG: TetR/AcrR family transcriptional regulator [Mesorhizobium sp.]
MIETDDIAADPKRARILEGAMKVFLAYGFSRTTMDDIARAADMSRPALYLVFKNKTDIYRATAMMVLSRSVEQAKAELAGDGAFADRMTRAIDAALISMMSTIAASPHGAELLDLKSSLADLVGLWRAGLVQHVAAAIEDQARQNGADLAAKGLSAKLLADMLLDGLEGMKLRISDPHEQRRAAAAMIKVIDLTLAA